MRVSCQSPSESMIKQTKRGNCGWQDVQENRALAMVALGSLQEDVNAPRTSESELARVESRVLAHREASGARKARHCTPDRKSVR